MANKILAAVLSLGAAMSNGSTSSAMEKTDKKNETQNSRRNIVSNYVKPGLNVLKENLSFKDLLYFLGMMKIYNSTRGNRGTIDISSAVKYLEKAWLKSYIPRETIKYIEFYSSMDLLFEFVRSSQNAHLAGAIKSQLITAQISRINNLLFVTENKSSEVENKIENIVKSDDMQTFEKAFGNTAYFVASQEVKGPSLQVKSENNNINEIHQTNENGQGNEQNLLKTEDLLQKPPMILQELLSGQKVSYNPTSGDTGSRFALDLSLLDDLHYLFRFTDKEIVNCILGSSNVDLKVCIQKLECLANDEGFKKEIMVLEPGKKEWPGCVARIKKLYNMLERANAFNSDPQSGEE